MPAIKVRPFEVSAGPAPAIKLSVKASKRGASFQFMMAQAAQEELFGRKLNPEADAIRLHLDDEAKQRHLLGFEIVPADHPEALPIKFSMRESIRLQVFPWTDHSIEKRPAITLETISQTKETVVVKLPEWARPPLPKPGQGKSIMDM